MKLKNLAISLALFALATVPARAQVPRGTITIVVPYGPGGATDLVARVVAEGMSKKLGNTVIVENKPGAFGITAMEYVKAADADGRTLLMQNVTTGGLTPLLYAKKMSFDPMKEFKPVTRIAQFDGVFVASKASHPAFTSFKEMITWAKKNPGKLRVGNVGKNSIPHLDAMKLAKEAGIKANHIPATSGGAGMVADLINGDLHVAGLNVASAKSLVQSGKGVALIAAAPKRLAAFPDVPTEAELGYTGVGSGNWQAIFVRKGVPDAVVNTLNDAIRAAVMSKTATTALTNANADIILSKDPAEVSAWLDKEISGLKSDIASLGIQASK